MELVDRVLVDYFSSEGAFCLRHRRSFADFNPGWGSLLDTAPCSKSGGDAPVQGLVLGLAGFPWADEGLPQMPLRLPSSNLS